MSITSSNQQAVAGDALSTGTNTSFASSGTALVTGVQLDAGSGDASGPVLLAAVARQLALQAPAGGLATGATVNQTVQCASGGTLTVSGSKASSTALAAGDSVTMTAANCKETVGTLATTMNGTLKIDITAGSFTSGSTVYPQHLAMKLTATGFTVVNAAETDTMDGDLTVDVTMNSSTDESETLSGTAMKFTATTASGTKGFSLKSYSESYSVSAGTSTYSVNASVETINTRLGNVGYTIATNTPVVKANGVYTAGSITVTGSKSALQVTVTGADTFELKLDTDGNGTWDSTTTRTLADLQ